MRITMEHVRQVRGFNARPGFCRKGVKRWFESRGLDYSDFLKNGIEEQTLLDTGDPMAVAVVRQAHGKQ